VGHPTLPLSALAFRRTSRPVFDSRGSDAAGVHCRTRSSAQARLSPLGDSRRHGGRCSRTSRCATAGIIDSFSLAQIGVFVEDAFGVYVPDTDLSVANMDTIERMVTCIRKARL
jgi:hypothetical protein